MECFQEARDQTWNPSERTSPNFSEWGALSWWGWGQWSVLCQARDVRPPCQKICKAGGCVFKAHFSFIAKFSWKQRRFRRRNSEIMTSIFSYLHNTDCLPNLLSHSDLSKSGKNTQDGRSWTRARITCQNTDQNFTSACSSPCLKSHSFPRYKAKPGLLPSAIYSLSRNKSRHHKNFSDCTFSRLKLKWVMTG